MKSYSNIRHFISRQEMVRIGNTFVSNVLDLKMKGKMAAKEAGDDSLQGQDMAKGKGKRKAFLDHLLSSEDGKTLSKDELAGELKHLVAAANSTTSDTLSFFLYCIAIRQDVQQRILEASAMPTMAHVTHLVESFGDDCTPVLQELDAVLEGDYEREVKPADLPQLKYLERVFKETLRCFAPAPLYARQPDSVGTTGSECREIKVCRALQSSG